LVRGDDAIVIDFPKCDRGPARLDLATLEISICFDSKKSDNETFRDWQDFVKDMYSAKKIVNPPLR